MAFDYVEWMAEHGHPEYRDKIDTLNKSIDILENNSEFFVNGKKTKDAVSTLKNIIEETRVRAEDRYQDWATED